MKRIVRLTERDLTRIVKRVIIENEKTKLINESAESIVADAKNRLMKGEKPDDDILGEIKNCIKNNNLKFLNFLTLGGNRAILEVMATVFIMNPLITSTLLTQYFTYIVMTDDGIGQNSVSESVMETEIAKLVKCMMS